MKKALITGSANRIGKAMAISLAKKGYNIVLHYNRSKQAALETANIIKELGVEVILEQINFAENNELEERTINLFDKHRDVTLVINNASIFYPSKYITSKSDEIRLMMDIHVIAPYIFTKSFAKLKTSGHIINMVDTKISKNSPGYFSYILSKKALFDLSQLSAVELSPHIRVNMIAPGLILPPADKDGDYLSSKAQYIPLKSVGNTQEICKAVEFLENSKFITGQCIYVDGGESIL